jgi:hypothetical protein
MEKRRGAHRVLVGKPEGRRVYGRPRNRSVGNIRIDFKEIGWKGLEWIDLAYRDKWWAVMTALINLWVLLNVSNFLAS